MMNSNRGRKRKPQGYKPDWLAATFGILLTGYWFKASKSHLTWWVKKDESTATSPNGQLESKWSDKDLVWIDLNTRLDRKRFTNPTA